MRSRSTPSESWPSRRAGSTSRPPIPNASAPSTRNWPAAWGPATACRYLTDRKLPDGTLRPIRVSYRASRHVGEAAVFVRGMVVPAAGWSRLFLALLAGLGLLAILPGQIARKRA